MHRDERDWNHEGNAQLAPSLSMDFCFLTFFSFSASLRLCASIFYF